MGHLDPGAGISARATEQLAVEFTGVLPRAAIDAEVRVAELELRGQVPAGSLDEMLHRLAGHRLRERAALKA